MAVKYLEEEGKSFEIVEYLKEIQVDFEQSMSLNMGQWLSIPLVAFGLFLIFRAQKTS